MDKKTLTDIFNKAYERFELKKFIKEELFKAINEEHWITIGSDKETDRKGTHILVKDGETNKQATERKIAEWKAQKDNKNKPDGKPADKDSFESIKKQVEDLRNILRDYDNKYEDINKKLSEHRRNIYQLYEDNIKREDADRKKREYIKKNEKELDKLAKEEESLNENRNKKQKELDTILNKEVEKILDTEIDNLDKDTLEKLMRNSRELFRMPILFSMQEKLRTKISEMQEKLGGLKYQNERKEITQIAGVSKGKPMSFDEADNGRVNPNYGNHDVPGISFSQNCQSCVVCYQLRKNGFNVKTKGIPVKKNGDVVESGKMYELAQAPEKAWIDPKTGAAPEVNKCDATTPSKAYKWLDKSIEEGGTYSFRVIWKGAKSGHIVIAHRIDGALTVYDPQTNKVYDDETAIVDRFFNECILRTQKEHRKPYLFRTDNLDANPDFVNEIVEKA